MEVKLPPQLIEEIHQNNTVLFVGAGLSMQAGFPGWEELIVHMIEWADNLGLIDSREEREELKQLVKKGELLLVASELRELMTPRDYLTFMKSKFRDESKKPAVVHRLLPEIGFQAVLTTNYDVLLESAYTLPGSNRPRTYTQEDAAELATLNSKKEFYILKVHGDIDRIDTVVLGRRDYRKIMFENKAYRDFFKTLLQSRTVLFAGYGLKDPDLEMILNELASTFKGYGNCHYALVSEDSMGKIEKKRWRRDYNINTISYKATKGHPEVLRFFELLKDELDKKKSRTLSEEKSINKSFFNERKILPQHFYEINGYLDTICKKEKYLDRYYISLSGKAQQMAVDLESDFPDLLIQTEFEVLEKNRDDKPKDFKLLDDIEDVLRTHSRFILLGPPGSGKTKTLEKILLSQARLARENLNLRIPLLIDLAEWVSDNDDLSKLIKKNRDANGLPPLYFDQFILLFDGLNEMEAKRSDQRLETIKKNYGVRYFICHLPVPFTSSSRLVTYLTSTRPSVVCLPGTGHLPGIHP
jgi:hypothetical protein